MNSAPAISAISVEILFSLEQATVACIRIPSAAPSLNAATTGCAQVPQRYAKATRVQVLGVTGRKAKKRSGMGTRCQLSLWAGLPVPGDNLHLSLYLKTLISLCLNQSVTA